MSDTQHPGADPEDGDAAADAAASPSTESAAPHSEDGDTADIQSVDELVDAEDADVETLTDEELSFLEAGELDLLAEMRKRSRPCSGRAGELSQARRA
ncbi:MAG: hypothetical protein WDM88_07085 [Galbitalea sp.]